MSIVNLDEYKSVQQSKVIVDDLRAIIAIINTANIALRLFHYYWPVRELMISLRDAKTILEIHKAHHEQLIKARGDKGGE